MPIVYDETGQAYSVGPTGEYVPLERNQLLRGAQAAQDAGPLGAARAALRPEPGYDYGAVLPYKMKPGEPTSFRPTVPLSVRDMASGLLDMLEGPSRAGAYLREGTVAPTDVVTPNALLSTTTAGMGVPKLPNTVGIFGGQLANTADLKALEQARKMAGAGWVPPAGLAAALVENARKRLGLVKSPEEIWQKTGWTDQFADRLPRFEIDDSAASLRHSPDLLIARLKKFPTTAEHVLDHPDLWKAYPELAGMKVKYGSSKDNIAAFNPKTREITLYEGALKDPEMTKSALLHELQHAVQHKEGFAPGSNPKQFFPPNWHRDFEHSVQNEELLRRRIVGSSEYGEFAHRNKYTDNLVDLMELATEGTGKLAKLPAEKQKALLEDFKSVPMVGTYLAYAKRTQELQDAFTGAYKKYNDTAGEVEARLTQDRMKAGAEGRRLAYPLKNVQPPVGEQIVLPPEQWR